MAVLEARKPETKSASEVRNCSVDWSGRLDSGELATGTPTITEITTTALTLTNKAVSTAALTIKGITVATGKAVTFTVSAGSAATTYGISINCATDATNGQTLYAKVNIDVEADPS